MLFELPKLKYSYSDLEPFIDAQTVEIHYSKHHQTYANNLNKALENKAEFADWSIEKILTDFNIMPEEIRTAVKNNAGGFYNHNLYWATMGKDVQKAPDGKFADQINSTFGSFQDFKAKMSLAGMTRFGSGWAWLVVNPQGKLEVLSTPNQDSPFTTGNKPILGLDVWEHAYYLKYQNRRADYIDNWWNVVDWKAVEKLYSEI